MAEVPVSTHADIPIQRRLGYLQRLADIIDADGRVGIQLVSQYTSGWSRCIGGRPPLRPRARAAANPAFVRSWINLRSNWAKAEKMLRTSHRTLTSYQSCHRKWNESRYPAPSIPRSCSPDDASTAPADQDAKPRACLLDGAPCCMLPVLAGPLVLRIVCQSTGVLGYTLST